LLNGSREQAVSTVKLATSIIIYERPGQWNEVLLHIWPLGGQPVRWPGKKGLDGYRGFLLLRDRFSQPEAS
jgi:hypothetical protein